MKTGLNLAAGHTLIKKLDTFASTKYIINIRRDMVEMLMEVEKSLFDQVVSVQLGGYGGREIIEINKAKTQTAGSTPYFSILLGLGFIGVLFSLFYYYLIFGIDSTISSMI